MLVLGLDPSSTSTGFGLIQRDGRRVSSVAYIESGCFRPSRGATFAERLITIYGGICDVLRRHQPDVVAMEDSFYGKDADAAAKLGEARGVLRLAVIQAGLDPALYTPAEVKKALTGNGQASKESVQYMVAQALKMKQLPRPLDASDALAVAICHLHRSGISTSQEGGRKADVEALLRRVCTR